MAKSKNNLFGASPKIPLGPATRLPAAATSATPRDTTIKTASVSTLSRVTPINFGSFRSKSGTATQGSSWSSLLQQAATGGIASALGGELSTITGLGGLVSGILSLFGNGKSAPPAPVQFTLPQSQQSSVAVHQQSGLSAVSSSTASSSSSAGSGTKSLTVAYQPSAPVASHTQVVQVVKQALLNSSSLNDVVAEI